VSPREAKEILLLFRPGTEDARDPQVRAAMEEAGRDPELGRWFEQHQSFQAAMRGSLRQIAVPEHLKAALLSAQKEQTQAAARRPAAASRERPGRKPGWRSWIWPFARGPRQAWWPQAAWLGAATAIAVLVCVAVFHARSQVPDRFADYRAMMVSKAVRGYNMDWTTEDMQLLRRHFGEKGAPANYELSRGLETLQLSGGASFTWRGNPVSMVCFKRGANQNFWLFVMKSDALKDPPGQAPKLDGTLSGLATASWTDGGNIYLLAGPDEADFGAKYLPKL